MRYLLSFFVGVLLSASLYAQSAGDKRSSFSVHAGPSWYLGRFVGITDRADTYRSDLRKGVAWDVNYLGQITGRELKFGLGFLYREVRIRTHMILGQIRYICIIWLLR